MNGIGISCDVLLVHDDNTVLCLQQGLCSGSTVLRDVKRYQESSCLGRYGKINRYRISPFRHRNTQMYGQSAPIKAILDGSVAENQYTEPLMSVLRAMDKFWDYKSNKLEDLLNRPKPGRISMIQRNGLDT
jgi:hypothetical protein